MDQPGKAANPARGQLNRGNEYFPCPRSRLRIWPHSRDGFDSPVPRQPALLTNRLNLAAGAITTPEYYLLTVFFRGLFKTAIRHRVSPEFIGSRNGVPMAFTAESPPAQGQ